MSTSKCFRKVKGLQSRAREEADRLGLDPEDMVILTTTFSSLPVYSVEKIEGNPVEYLLKRAEIVSF